MKLGIMQPYFFPYLGYWQLIQAVDQYVIFDDANYIKNGWVNRNRILIAGKPAYFNVPLCGASIHKKINEIMVNPDIRLRQKGLKTLENAYGRAPYFKEVYPLAEEILKGGGANLGEYLTDSIRLICGYLRIDTELLLSSALPKNPDLKGQERILDMCRHLKAEEYYNAEGGQELYSYQKFRENGIRLAFIKSRPVSYRQPAREFIPNLSILDVMMFNSVDAIRGMLGSYELITETGTKRERTDGRNG